MIDIKIASDSTLNKENCRGKNRTVNVYITCVKFLGGVCKLSKFKNGELSVSHLIKARLLTRSITAVFVL